MASRSLSMSRQVRTRPVPSVEVRHFLPSRIAEISPLITQLMSLIGTSRAPDGSEREIELALREALANAVVHGNCEDPEKRIEVSCRCGADGSVNITIGDQGEGFDTRGFSDSAVPDSRAATQSRGILLMRAMMDEVWFSGGGTVVHMRKKPNASWE